MEKWIPREIGDEWMLQNIRTSHTLAYEDTKPGNNSKSVAFRGVLINGHSYFSSNTNSIPHFQLENLIIAQLNEYGSIKLEYFPLTSIRSCVDPIKYIAMIVAAGLGDWSFVDEEQKSYGMIYRQPAGKREVRRLTTWLFDALRSVNLAGWLPSLLDVKVLLKCIVQCKDRFQRNNVPYVIKLFYIAVVLELKTKSDMAWSNLDKHILSHMSSGLKDQLLSHIFTYRKFGFFAVFSTDSKENTELFAHLDDRILKICTDLLQGMPEVLFDNKFSINLNDVLR